MRRALGKEVRLLGHSTALRGVANTASSRVRWLRERLGETLGERDTTRLVAEGEAIPRPLIRENVGRWLSSILPEDVDLGGR